MLRGEDMVDGVGRQPTPLGSFLAAFSTGRDLPASVAGTNPTPEYVVYSLKFNQLINRICTHIIVFVGGKTLQTSNIEIIA